MTERELAERDASFFSTSTVRDMFGTNVNTFMFFFCAAESFLVQSCSDCGAGVLAIEVVGA